MKIKPILLPLFLLLVLLCSCNSSDSGAPAPDPVYGAVLSDLYREKQVKEVFVEMDRYQGNTMLYPRFLYSYAAINKNGQIIRQEFSEDNLITLREDREYAAKGQLLSTLYFERPVSREEQEPGRDGIDWELETRKLHVSSGGETAGEYRWLATDRKWVQKTEERHWVKNDTAYTETREVFFSLGEDKEITRVYQLGNDRSITRKDFIGVLPHGRFGTRYTYTKADKGKVVEAGNVVVSDAFHAHLKKHPEEALAAYRSDDGFYRALDNYARHTPGALQPTCTYTYNPKGLIRTKKEHLTETIYQRDEAGRATRIKIVEADNSGSLTRFYFNELGLLQTEVRENLNAQPVEILYYNYTFYP